MAELDPSTADAARLEALAANAPGEGALTPLEYNTIIGPSLKVCAALAASRGDEWLATDLPCMIALLHVTRGLLAHYQDEWGALGEASPASVLEGAPDAACVLVMQEAEFDDSVIPQCLDALHRAHQQLRDADVLAEPATEKMLVAAWRGLSGGETVTAETLLSAVAGNVVGVVDSWEQAQAGSVN